MCDFIFSTRTLAGRNPPLHFQALERLVLLSSSQLEELRFEPDEASLQTIKLIDEIVEVIAHFVVWAESTMRGGRWTEDRGGGWAGARG